MHAHRRTRPLPSCQVRGDRKCVSCGRQPDCIARWFGTGGRSNETRGGDTNMTNKAERRPRSSAISRRRVVTSLTVGVGAAASSLARALRNGCRWRRPAPSRRRRAISVRRVRRPHISPIPTCSPSIRCSTSMPNPTAPSSACGPARCGRRGRPGTPRAAISSGATSPIIGSFAGWRTTARCRCFACRRTTATGTRSTSRAGRSPAST